MERKGIVGMIRLRMKQRFVEMRNERDGVNSMNDSNA